jgi:pilus assembly protein Flp/PilA
MKAIKNLTRRRDQKGATIIEYILIAALLSIAAIVVLGSLGSSISTKFGEVDTAVSASGT